MFHYTYVLKSSLNNNLYVGHCKDLRQRLKEHNQGLNRSTKPNRPWILVYYEACRNKNDAVRREKQLKTGFGRAYLRKRINVPR